MWKIVRDLSKAFGGSLLTIGKILAVAFVIWISTAINAGMNPPWAILAAFLSSTCFVLWAENTLRLVAEREGSAQFSRCQNALTLVQSAGADHLREDVQKYVDNSLRERARSVKKASDRLIILQKGGFEALAREGVEVPQFKIDDDQGMETARKELRLKLTKEFEEKQEAFYKLYDQYKGASRYYCFSLKNRGWKEYLGEGSAEKSA